MSNPIDTGEAVPHSVLNSSFPVLLPADPTLLLPEAEFQAFLKQTLPVEAKLRKEEAPTEVDNGGKSEQEADTPKAPFLVGLEKHAAHHQSEEALAAKNQSLTENADVTNISSKDPLVDLFYDLGEGTTCEKLRTLLQNAWEEDALLTLKIIFNARSIHLGKSNRVAAYKAFGWLAENHPLTLLANLRWLVRPVIAKKATKEKEEGTQKISNDEDFDMIDIKETDPEKAFDVRYGVSHGYWKDLLNLVVFAANDQLNSEGDPASLLDTKEANKGIGKRQRDWNQKSAKEARNLKKKEQNERVQQKLKNDSFYRALHFSVARLFAEQLKEDKALLDSGERKDLKKLSLAAKWAPTFGEFHDKHTFILSSIAEVLYPDAALHCPDANDREAYLRQVRELYRKQYASPLRKALSVVERDIAAQTFENIKYDRVPSLAMDRYSGLFVEKDLDRFKSYVQDVAKGDAQISGATLLPSTLINKARLCQSQSAKDPKDLKAMKAAIKSEINKDILDGQWNTLVKRIKEAGTLQSSLAVCDVSGSMSYPQFKDQSCPMDSAIGLSLLISEVTAPPFGGGFITFSEYPSYVSLAHLASKGIVEKVHYIEAANWSMNTDFVAVFENVILPMAISNKLSQEDMVKQIFVFSDMQFDSADSGNSRWTTSYDRVKQKYIDAGYEMPRLIFWNLASGSTSKPTTMDDSDTALVSGYSQGMLRAFLESGAFEDEVDIKQEDEVMVEGEDSTVKIDTVKKKIDPLTVVKKAVNHPAYAMLQTVD